MSRILHKQDYIEMAWGAICRSDGGDYPLPYVLDAIEKIEKKGEISIEVWDIDEMPEDTVAISACKMGPIDSENLGSVFDPTDGIAAFKKMKEMVEAEGKTVSCIYTAEHDAVLVPFYIQLSQATGLPMLNADGSARSVPSLELLLPFCYGEPYGKFAFGTGKGDTIELRLADPFDVAEVENIGRALCMCHGDVIGVAFPDYDKKVIEKSFYIGSMDSLMESGRALLKAKKEGSDPAEAFVSTIEGAELFRGKVCERELITRDGFDFGLTKIETEQGKYTLRIQNEILAVEDSQGQLILVSPDSAIMINLASGMGVTNGEIREGDEVAVVGIRAAAPWTRMEDPIKHWRFVHHNVGLDDLEYFDFRSK